MTPKQQDIFFEIINYLNDHNRQWVSRLWETELGHVWIYFGRHGWEAHWFEEGKWPEGNA